MGDLATTNTFVSGATAVASEVNTNFSDVVNYINARNTGTSKWDSLKTSGNASVDGTLTVTGAAYFASTLSVGSTDVVAAVASLTDGWVAAGETWTYASATTFTIAGDQTGKYSKGDKIKFSQSGQKYFYIIGVSYGAPNTTITVTGGVDYTIANAAIGSPYYSKQNSPNGFPLQFNWTPAYTGFSSNPTTTAALFSISGGFVYLYYKQNALGTSNSTSFSMTGLPINFGTLDGTGARRSVRLVPATNNSIGLGYALGSISGTTFTFQNTVDNDTSWTASGTKGVWGFQEIIPLP
jgi:hypothetical protein